MDLKLITHNVNGLGEFKARKRYFSYMLRLNKDIVLLQETHSNEKDEALWRNQVRCNIIFSHGTTKSRGVCTILRKTPDIKLIDTVRDTIGRFLLVKVEIKGRVYAICNVYSPNTEKEQIEFFKELELILQENISGGEILLIGGDFNLIQDLELDRVGGSMRNVWQRSVSLIENIKSYFRLVDIWRTRNPSAKKFTWRRYNPMPVQSRLDFWLIHESLQNSVVENNIIPCVLSDHDHVSLHVRSRAKKIGPSYWKFNNRLLQDEDYVNTLTEKYAEWIKEFPDSPDKGCLWDWLKFRIREFTVPFSKKKKCDREEKRLALENELEKLDNVLSEMAHPDEESIKRKKEIEHELFKIYDFLAEGAIMRSRCTWYEKGEKSTKYFLSLEKGHAVNSMIDVLLSKDGHIDEQPDLQNFIKDSYQTLFENKDCVEEESCKQYIFECNLKQLSHAERVSCEGKITCGEARAEILQMARNKTPGNDGLTVEFYDFFWPLINKQVVDSYNYAFENETMSVSQRQGTIKLIPKPDRDRYTLGNWRPITLLNVDVKILSKCLAKRVSKVIGKLVASQQTAFIKGRYIGEGIRLISDLLHTEEQNLSGILLALDLTKAFDCVSHRYILTCLEAFNFGPSFIQWVKTLHRNISSCVLVNGFTTGYFSVSRGVRQGDPLAPLIFILCLEVFLARLTDNDNIQALEFQGRQLKYTAYADDITCFCKNSQSVKEVFSAFEEFSKISGLHLNKSKTVGMWIGKDRQKGEKNTDLQWADKSIKVLGIHFSYDKEVCKKLNFDNRLEEIKHTFLNWKNRGLTLVGKIQLLKTFVMSKIMYIISNIEIPDDFVMAVEKLMFKFIWNGPDKIARATMFADYIDGGLKFPKLECMIETQLVKWVQRFYAESDHQWKLFFEYYCSRVGGILIFMCNYSKCHLKALGFPVFYQNVLVAWSKTKLHAQFTDDQSTQAGILSQIVWNNYHILVDKKTIYCKTLHEAGLCYVYDLFDRLGNIRSFDFWRERGVSCKYFLTYLAIVSNVKRKWCVEFNQLILQMFQAKMDYEQSQSNLLSEELQKLKTKLIYIDLVEKHIARPISETLFAKKYDIQEEEWPQLYLLPFKCTIEVKLRVFQFKILHNILYTNERLFKMKQVDTDICTFCQISIETPVHLFYDCNVAEKLRREFVDKIGLNLSVKFEDLTRKRLMFGFIKDWKGPHKTLLNHLIIIFKRYIYIQRCKNESVNINGLEAFVGNIRHIELVIAKQKRKENIHYRKWSPIEKVL